MSNSLSEGFEESPEAIVEDELESPESLDEGTPLVDAVEDQTIQEHILPPI